jgi:predicted methyltransferase
MSMPRIPIALTIVAAALLAACAGQRATTAGATAAPVTDAATIAALEKTLAGDHRSAANRARDIYRHPKETLTFFGLRQDMTVMEVWPGGGGWYTEVLAPVLRDHGRYIAASWDPNTDSKYTLDNIKAYADKLASRPDMYGKATVTALQYPNELKPVPDRSVDMVLTFRNLHNWMSRDAAQPMLAAMFRALKPGGILGMVEHRASDNVLQDPYAKSGYVREDYAIALATAAGFELIGRSNINANPKDTKDYPEGVWSLPPTYREGDVNREHYAAIGESDRFTLRFRKPL